MTNRDWLRNLSNEKLAELLARGDVCSNLIETCPDGDCMKCITKWLKAESKLKKEINEKHDECLSQPMERLTNDEIK